MCWCFLAFRLVTVAIEFEIEIKRKRRKGKKRKENLFIKLNYVFHRSTKFFEKKKITISSTTFVSAFPFAFSFVSLFLLFISFVLGWWAVFVLHYSVSFNAYAIAPASLDL